MDWTAVWAAIKLIPRLLNAMEQFGKAVKQYNLEKWISEVDDATEVMQDPEAQLKIRAAAVREFMRLTRKL